MTNLLFDTLFHGQPDDSTCLILEDDSTISYGELLHESARVANALVELGIQPGDRVAAQIDKSVAAVALYLGIVRAGAAFLPLNTAYTAREVEYFINDAEPALFICKPGSELELGPMSTTANAQLKTLDSDGKAGSWIDLVNEAADEFTTVARDADDLATILYTSGTTGRSKGAMITHQNLAANSITLVKYWGFSADDVLLHALPIFHIHGLFVAINTAMIAGASMVFLPGFNNQTVLEYLPKCTVMMGVPTFYTRLLALDKFNRAATKHMRLFISGSAPMTLETHKAFQQRTGQTILERYGMTETNMNTSNPYDGERVAGSVGFPLPGVELRITDPKSTDVKELPTATIGMIEVRGPNVFKGYWQMPEKTAEEFRGDGFFITGDLGMIDDQGYVHIVGRNKDLVISGGYNVYPKEIEILIDNLDGVYESAVIGLPHKDLGEVVIAVVVKSANSTIDEATIKTALKDQLARYKQPREIFFIDVLPRNAMSKVQKNELRQTYQDLYVRQ
ncbi:MAG: malonyl-CoA/methylmalonyl-CoA synthetase [Gammaproteobacteria bacterium]|jgi:malonyl-CoA/methylmalonyl-CoA synthetase